MSKVFHSLLIVAALALCSCSAAQTNPNSTGSSGSSSSASSVAGVTYSPDGTASLVYTNEVRILKLSGTNYQMGYNYGYLLAAEIVELVGGIATWGAQAKSADYDILISQQSLVNWEADILAEMNGMIAGIRDALPASNRSFTPFGSTNRQISVEDLQVAHTLPAWACSSFSVWGAGRSDGSSLMARNLDYYVDPYGVLVSSHLVVSYNPSQGLKWVNIAFCGMVGVLSGMNEYGVSGVMHDTGDFDTTDSGGIVPRGIALRRLLERLSNTTVPADAESILDAMPNETGNNFHVLYSSSGRADTNTACVLEYDGCATHPDGRCTLRTTADNPFLPTNSFFDQRFSFTNALINVNHYMKRTNVAPGSGNNSGSRYITVKNNLSNAMQDGNVAVEEGRQIMSLVGFSSTIQTIQTMVFEPNTGRIHLWLGTTNVRSYNRTENLLEFSGLF